MKTLAVSLLLAASSAPICAACECRVSIDTSAHARTAALHATAGEKEGKTGTPAPKAPAPTQPKSPPAPREPKPGPPPVLFM